jgi:hypothetical protein
MKNYFKQLMTDGYDLLVASRIKWPGELLDSQKVELLEQAIEYFREQEEYEKCAILKKKIDKICNIKPKRKSYVKKENSTGDRC